MITKEMMIKAVEKTIEGRETAAAKNPKGFAKWGNDNRLNTAKALLKRLQNGIKPSTQEVVAYFGKGARFAE